MGCIFVPLDYNQMKDLTFGRDGRTALVNGIEKMSQAVASTLGPCGRTVVMESQSHTNGMTVTKDGVTVARAITLKDPVENLAVRMMRQAADRTALVAGDGTTTSIVLTDAMVRRGIEELEGSRLNKVKVMRELEGLRDEVLRSLKVHRMSKRRIKDVATISANNDRAIGGVIAEAYEAIGRSGVVTVENSPTTETYVRVTKGIRMDRGWSSQAFINNAKSDECIMEDVYVLCTDVEIGNILQIETVLKAVINGGHKLLLVAPVTQGVLNTLAANVVKNGLKLCVVNPPSFGYRQGELMSDLALSLGTGFYSEKTGDELSHITLSHLGRAERIVVGRETSVIIPGGEERQEVLNRVSELKEAIGLATRKGDADFLRQRVAYLEGGVAIVYVGGETDLEQKERYDRVDDAVCAVRAALEGGVVAGGGAALLRAASFLGERDGEEGMLAHRMMVAALVAPFNAICANAGLTEEETRGVELEVLAAPDYGYDALSGEVVDMVKAGVVDPVKVTSQALTNAVSVASTILSTDTIITFAE